MQQKEIFEYLSEHKDRFQKLYSLNAIDVFGSYTHNEGTVESDILGFNNK